MFQFERQALERFLKSAKFPLTQQQLIDQAQEAEVPHQIVSLLQRLDDRTFKSAEEVENQLAAHKA
jgi:hypothetical protein